MSLKIYKAEDIINCYSHFWVATDECAYRANEYRIQKDNLVHGERIIILHNNLEYTATIDTKNDFLKNFELI